MIIIIVFCTAITFAILTGIISAGSFTATNVIAVSLGYGLESEPLCVTEVTVNNECLDSGNKIFLEIDSDSLPKSVAVAEECDEAVVEVFDDEGITNDNALLGCDMLLVQLISANFMVLKAWQYPQKTPDGLQHTRIDTHMPHNVGYRANLNQHCNKCITTSCISALHLHMDNNFSAAKIKCSTSCSSAFFFFLFQHSYTCGVLRITSSLVVISFWQLFDTISQWMSSMLMRTILRSRCVLMQRGLLDQPREQYLFSSPLYSKILVCGRQAYLKWLAKGWGTIDHTHVDVVDALSYMIAK